MENDELQYIYQKVDMLQSEVDQLREERNLSTQRRRRSQQPKRTEPGLFDFKKNNRLVGELRVRKPLKSNQSVYSKLKGDGGESHQIKHNNLFSSFESQRLHGRTND